MVGHALQFSILWMYYVLSYVLKTNKIKQIFFDTVDMSHKYVDTWQGTLYSFYSSFISEEIVE